MCGRYTLKTSPKELAQLFGPLLFPELAPRYNVAPSQPVPVVRDGETGREAALLRWGLVPPWSKDPSAGFINARAETVATKPAFRSAFKSRRCLMPADGFYEWAKAGSKKQPWHFRLKDGGPFAFAALWETWGEGDSAVESCALITGEPNAVVAPVHDRMPVILPIEHYDLWLDPEAKPNQLASLLAPYPAAEMEGYPVSTRVNSPRSDGPDLIQPS